MIAGVKIGPKNWQEILNKGKPDCCEVWFRLDWADQFANLFKTLNKKNILFGLHFWAMLPGKIEPNLAWEKEEIADQTVELMKQTIDIAQKIGARYVNVHPGSLMLKKLDLENQQMTLIPNKKISLDKARKSLIPRVKLLNQYASKADLLLLVETLPKNEPAHFRDHTERQKVQEVNNIPLDLMIELANAGIFITNDIGHTAASLITKDREKLWKYLLKATKNLASQTKLIHLNTILPPFNGTDSHNGLLKKDFDQNVFPTKNQIIELLKIFCDRDDIWIIPEPEMKDMVRNYRVIKHLLEDN